MPKGIALVLFWVGLAAIAFAWGTLMAAIIPGPGAFIAAIVGGWVVGMLAAPLLLRISDM